VPGGEQAPAAAVRLEQVHQVVAEVGLDALALRAADEGAHVHDVVADEQVGPRAGQRRPDADGGDRRADGAGGPLDRKARRRPRRAGPQPGEDIVQRAVAGDRFRKEAAALRGDRLGRANHFDAQAGVAAEFPEDAAAQLRRLAVVAWQLDQPLAVVRQKALERAVQFPLAHRPAARFGEAEFDEVVRVGARGFGRGRRVALAGRFFGNRRQFAKFGGHDGDLRCGTSGDGKPRGAPGGPRARHLNSSSRWRSSGGAA
jgi:hypothetical protein